MLRRVSNKINLRKRLDRFFQTNSSRKNLTFFLDMISTTDEVVVFGGCIRDIALYGIRNFRSDIDIVFTGSQKKLKEIMMELDPRYEVKINKFGGFRAKVGIWDVDIWSLKATWAFKNNFVKFNGEESLLLTTITNWDAIYFKWRKREIVCIDSYFEDILSGHLSLVLPFNPNILGSLVRILRFNFMKEANFFSHELGKFLLKNFDSFSVSDVINYEKQSYPLDTYLTHSSVDKLLRIVKDNIDTKKDIKLTPRNQTEDMFN